MHARKEKKPPLPPEGSSPGEVERLKKELEHLKKADDAKSRVLKVLGQVTAQESVDDICRAIVEGIRQELGFDRVGLFIWDDTINWFRGTFGTGLNGETTDERHIIWAIQPDYYRKIQQGETFVRGCIVGEPLPQPGEEGVTADLVALRRGGKLYGVISVDNRITRRPISQQELEYLTLFVEVLGNAMEIARARTAVEASQRRFEQVAEMSREWIWEADRSWRYTYSSPAVERVLGYAPKDVIGRRIDELMRPALRRAAMASIQADMKRDGRVEGLGLRLVGRNGEEVICEMFAAALTDGSGACIGYRGCYRDVTRERRLESELLHAQKLEAIGRLAAGIAHDFNNILTSILGVVGLLLEELGEGDPIRADIEQIKQASERAASLTRQLLSFSRSQIRGDRVIDLGAEVAQIEDFLRRVIGENVGLVMNLPREACRIKADPSEIKQIVLELVVNARDAILERKEPSKRPAMITVTVGKVKLDRESRLENIDLPPGGYAMLSVSDTGVGMDEETRQKIFEPFFTTRSDLRRRGLGLSSVYGLVHNRGGDIQVESRLGEGTTVRIYLPLAPSGETRELTPEEEDQPVATKDSASPVILVVEDEEPIRFLIKRKLDSLGYRVLEAADGRQALEVAAQHPGKIDMVITDLVMPEMSGKQLVENLRRMGNEAKVLYITGYSSDETVAGEKLSQSDRLIEKPFTMDVLAAAVTDILGKRR